MSDLNHIDRIFKAQLNEVPVNNTAGLWEKLEKQLDAPDQPTGSKKRYAMLLLVLLLAGGTISYFLFNHKEAPASNSNGTNQQSISSRPDRPSSMDNNNAARNVDKDNNNINTSSADTKATAINQPVPSFNSVSPKRKKTVNQSGQYYIDIDRPATGNDPAVDFTVQEKLTGNVEMPKTSTATGETVIKSEQQQHAEPALTNPVKEPAKADVKEKSTANINSTKTKSRNEKPYMGIAAGMDLFLKAKELGGYAGIELNLPVNKKVNIVTGLQVSGHKMEQNYSNAEKQRLNPDHKVDAKLQHLTLLQLPILYEQPLPQSRIAFRAGLTPTYIVDAGIYNIPASGVNVVNYKKFGIDDLHRLNLLFTAGVGVRIGKKFQLELKGNYGLTELVKNSYINQSNNNNNFKSAQVGLIYKVKKKKE